LAVTDRVFMLENSIYSVISPEGCAALLWRDSAEAARAAEALKLTAANLRELGLIDAVIPEPAEGAHTDPRATVKRVMREVQAALSELERLDPRERLRLRREKPSWSRCRAISARCGLAPVKQRHRLVQVRRRFLERVADLEE
jgi:acetyl-CoA carboxylase carboxyl transferase subunit alpha